MRHNGADDSTELSVEGTNRYHRSTAFSAYGEPHDLFITPLRTITDRFR